MAKKILILNGPNLNLLGSRQPDVYGNLSLVDIEANCAAKAKQLNLAIDFRQSNHEGELVTWVQQAQAGSKDQVFDGIIINPAAYSHTSIAIADAITAISLPLIEVHISNIFARETFRHHSHISAHAAGVICGLGPKGYLLALSAIADLI